MKDRPTERRDLSPRWNLSASASAASDNPAAGRSRSRHVLNLARAALVHFDGSGAKNACAR